jgi:hypothetical protein
MKRFVLNGNERTDGCFTAAFFQTQRASFSGRFFQAQSASFSERCGDRTAVGGANGTRNNVPACAHKPQNNRTATSFCLPFLASAHIMDPDFKIFDNEILITEVEKRPALYN